jgi:hypothetical protein
VLGIAHTALPPKRVAPVYELEELDCVSHDALHVEVVEDGRHAHGVARRARFEHREAVGGVVFGVLRWCAVATRRCALKRRAPA